MNKHKGCNILGDYDWTCKLNMQKPKVQQAGYKPTLEQMGESVKKAPNPRRDVEESEYAIASVSWQDGTHDNSRKCSLCESRECKPKARVHKERYGLMMSNVARLFDASNPVI